MIVTQETEGMTFPTSLRCQARMASGVTMVATWCQQLAAERHAPRRQPTALIIAQSKALATELVFQEAILLPEVVDDA